MILSLAEQKMANAILRVVGRNARRFISIPGFMFNCFPDPSHVLLMTILYLNYTYYFICSISIIFSVSKEKLLYIYRAFLSFD